MSTMILPTLLAFIAGSADLEAQSSFDKTNRALRAYMDMDDLAELAQRCQEAAELIDVGSAAGPDALMAKPHPGPEPKLTAKQRNRLARMLRQGARKHGFATELWTLKRIGELIGAGARVPQDL